MIPRYAKAKVSQALKRQAAVALIGPRQSGKTTLALSIADEVDKSIYLDLEDQDDRAKLSNPALYLDQYADHLIVLDEIHRIPELFQTLRGVIDRGRRQGRRTGRFLILGSASIELLRQSGESLAGRIAYVDIGPLHILEVENTSATIQNLWIRGGFPDSFMASDSEESLVLRKDFIRTYLERDVQMFGPRVPAQTLERLWTMLAHEQGSVLNVSKFAGNLSVSTTTIGRYVDLLADLLLIRRLLPYHSNLGKRMIKSPKIYIRDSGILHALLGIRDFDALAGHPVIGASWEGFVIEQLLAVAPERTQASYYRTRAGAELDLVLELPGGEIIAVEIKSGLEPKLSKGLHHALEDVQPHSTFVVYAGKERFPLSKTIEAIPVWNLAYDLSNK